MSTLHSMNVTYRVKDLMQSDLITLSPDATAREAIEIFEDYKIGGAPVIDATGKILGVLTVSDIARKEHLVEGRLSTERFEYYFANPLQEDGGFDETAISRMDAFNPDVVGPDRVRDWMNTNIIDVTPETDIVAACTKMVENSIHRVLVVEDGHLCGILSSFDIVRHVAALE